MTIDISRCDQDRIPLMDRVGCSLLTFRGLPLADALGRIQAHGFHAVDIFVFPGHCEHLDPPSLGDDDVAALKADFASRGIRVSSLNVEPEDLTDPSFERGGPLIRSCLSLAGRMGIPIVTIPTGRPGWISAEAQWLEFARLVAGRIRPFLDLAEEAGVRLTVEAPHVGTLTDTVAKSRRFFELVDDPRLGCTLDTSHVQRTGEGSLREAYSQLGAEVLHVHLRDARLQDKLSDVLVTPGKGECDFLPLFRSLLADGYQGDFNFELEYRGAPTAEFVEGELKFAREYLRMLQDDIAPPFAYSRYKTGWYGTYFYARRALSQPKAFVRSHPRLIAWIKPPVLFTRAAHQRLAPHRKVKYQAGWVPRWKIGRVPSQIPYRPPATGAQVQAPPVPKRVAILGCGYTGGLMHGPGFANIPGIQVVGVCDIDRAKADKLSEQLSCPAFVDLAEMVRQTRPDLVANCTREWQHHETTLLLLESGVDVFCEKIMAEECRKGEEMVRVARERGRTLGVNFNWRFLPGIKKICELRDAGALGPLHFLRILCHANVHHHALDLARHIGGPIRSVTAMVRDDPKDRKFKPWNRYVGEMLYIPSTYCSALLESESGVGVSLTSTALIDPAGFQIHIDAIFQDGTATLSGILDEDAVGTFSIATKKRLDKRFALRTAPAPFASAFRGSIEAFAHAYLEGGACPITGEDGLNVMYIERAIMQSAESGAKVALRPPA